MKDTQKLISEAIAAAQSGRNFAEGFATDKDGVISREREKLGGSVDLFKHQLVRGMADRTIKACEHIKVDEPVPMFWVPYDPTWLNCEMCHDRVEMNIRGTREDATCDLCGAYVPDAICGTAVHMAAAVYPQIGVAFGPITIHYGLCETCKAKEQP